jgi:protein phosphatase
MKIVWQGAGVTDPGRLRRNDEDAFLVDLERGLFAVADGVGGSRGGDVASRIAVETATRVLDDHRPNGSGELAPDVIAQMFARGHAAILERAEREPALAGMATTLVLLFCDASSAWIAHCGDSRGYRWRAGALDRLSRDHSFAEALAQGGASIRAKSPFGHVLTRCLGGNGSSEPEIREIEALAGDRFLLCCDGLTDMVPEPELEALLSQKLPPDETGRRLIDSANAAGGKDNITAVVVDIRDA